MRDRRDWPLIDLLVAPPGSNLARDAKGLGVAVGLAGCIAPFVGLALALWYLSHPAAVVVPLLIGGLTMRYFFVAERRAEAARARCRSLPVVLPWPDRAALGRDVEFRYIPVEPDAIVKQLHALLEVRPGYVWFAHDVLWRMSDPEPVDQLHVPPTRTLVAIEQWERDVAAAYMEWIQLRDLVPATQSAGAAVECERGWS